MFSKPIRYCELCPEPKQKAELVCTDPNCPYKNRLVCPVCVTLGKHKKHTYIELNEFN